MTSEPCKSDRLPADRVAFVDGIHQHFLQVLTQALTTYLDTPIKASSAGIDQLPLSEFLADSGDACVMTLDLAPMRGQAWVGLSSSLVFRVLDILLGAPQPAVPSTRTAVTEIEGHVLGEFFQVMGVSLDRAWKASGISLRWSSVGSPEETRHKADLDGTALVLNCNLGISGEDSAFRVGVPLLAVRLAALQNEQIADTKGAAGSAARSARLDAVGRASLELEAVLSGSSIRLGDLAALQPGQVLVLTQPADARLECLVNGKPKYRGEWISHGDRHGLQVEKVLDAAAPGKH